MPPARHCLHAIVSICSLHCAQSLERYDEIRCPGPFWKIQRRRICIQHIDSYQITSSAAVSTRNKLATLQHGSAGIHFVRRGGFSRNFSLQLGVASNFRRSLTSRVAKQNPVPEGNEFDVATDPSTGTHKSRYLGSLGVRHLGLDRGHTSCAP